MCPIHSSAALTVPLRGNEMSAGAVLADFLFPPRIWHWTYVCQAFLLHCRSVLRTDPHVTARIIPGTQYRAKEEKKSLPFLYVFDPHELGKNVLWVHLGGLRSACKWDVRKGCKSPEMTAGSHSYVTSTGNDSWIRCTGKWHIILPNSLAARGKKTVPCMTLWRSDRADITVVKRHIRLMPDLRLTNRTNGAWSEITPSMCSTRPRAALVKYMRGPMNNFSCGGNTGNAIPPMT